MPATPPVVHQLAQQEQRCGFVSGEWVTNPRTKGNRAFS